jgi:hypothetical protein
VNGQRRANSRAARQLLLRIWLTVGHRPRFYRGLTIPRFARFWIPNRKAITMVRIAPEKSNFFMRCNYDGGAPGQAHKAPGRQEQVLKGAAKGLLPLVEQAIARIEQEDDAEAALRELWASLLEIKALRAHDPGIRMAAQDLYEAAAALVMDKPARAVVVDIRRWRLLKEADCRLRCRLEA